MSRQYSKHDLEDQEKFILIALNQRPHNKPEIIDIIKRLAMRFGMAIFLEETGDIEEFSKIEQALSYLVHENKVESDQYGVYSLTEKGEIEAQKYSQGLLRFFGFLNHLTYPSISPIISLIFHLFLGTIKMVGFFLIGSVSLLGDGLDSLMDGFSSIIVGLSMKIRKEKQATYLLLLLMIITGFTILYQGIERVLYPAALEEGELAITIALVSIVFCGVLYFYQRFSGYYNKSLTILAQSEDSKNHVLNAILVLIAIIASFGNIFIVDGLVGCFIGFIILRGAYEIYLDLKAQSQGEIIDYEKYKLGIWKRYDNLQNKILDLWILYHVDRKDNTLKALEGKFNDTFQPIVIGDRQRKEIWKSPQQKEHLEERIWDLKENGLLKEENQILLITKEGESKLESEINKILKGTTSRRRTKRHEKKIKKLSE
ncbi:MAG: cation diffusion facilitator family transporter [Candidatus Thorarchaeota archaeon]